MQTNKPTRYCRSRTNLDKAVTLIRLKREMAKNTPPSKTHVESLQHAASLIEIERQILTLGYDSE